MKTIIRTFLYSLFALWSATLVINSFKIKGDITAFLSTALILGLLFLIGRPILKVILFPINFLTAGFFSWILNVILLFLLVKLTPTISIKPWLFPGLSYQNINISPYHLNLWETFIVISLFIGIIVNLLSWLSK